MCIEQQTSDSATANVRIWNAGRPELGRAEVDPRTGVKRDRPGRASPRTTFRQRRAACDEAGARWPLLSTPGHLAGRRSCSGEEAGERCLRRRHGHGFPRIVSHASPPQENPDGTPAGTEYESSPVPSSRDRCLTPQLRSGSSSTALLRDRSRSSGRQGAVLQRPEGNDPSAGVIPLPYMDGTCVACEHEPKRPAVQQPLSRTLERAWSGALGISPIRMGMCVGDAARMGERSIRAAQNKEVA